MSVHAAFPLANNLFNDVPPIKSALKMAPGQLTSLQLIKNNLFPYCNILRLTTVLTYIFTQFHTKNKIFRKKYDCLKMEVCSFVLTNF
jgi:hypothetical protein